MRERLQKIIAEFGIASRRGAEEMIAEGRITVNGKTAVIGMKADPLIDHIKVNGTLITKKEPLIYIIFNKPAGIMSTLSDPEGRRTFKDYLKKIKQRVYPVGRLDYHSEGLLILTNDGSLANAIMHPSKKIPKLYRIKVRGIPEETKLRKLRTGIRLEDGYTLPAEIKMIGLTRTGKNSLLDVRIYQGKNRQIRRMFESIKHPVMKLKRIAIDGISLGQLRSGEYRHLTQDEVTLLKKEVGLNPS